MEKNGAFSGTLLLYHLYLKNEHQKMWKYFQLIFLCPQFLNLAFYVEEAVLS